MLVTVVVAAVLFVLARFYWSKCPHCGKRTIRIVGVESFWTADCREHRFHAGNCRRCGKTAYRRMDLFAGWKSDKEI